MLLALVALIGSCGIRHRRLRLTAVAFSSVLGMLVHEAFLIACLPVGLTAIFWLRGSVLGRLPRAEWAAAVLPTLAWACFLLTSSPLSISELSAIAQERSAFAPDRQAIVAAGQSAPDALEFTRRFWLEGTVQQKIHLGHTFLLMVPLGWGAARILSRAQLDLKPLHRKLVIASGLSPLLLVPIGIDWARWGALATTELGLLAAVALLVERERRAPLQGQGLFVVLAFYGVALSILTLGRLHVVFGFDQFPGWHLMGEAVARLL